mgnify:CR=1 FL=1
MDFKNNNARVVFFYAKMTQLHTIPKFTYQLPKGNITALLQPELSFNVGTIQIYFAAQL